MVRAVPLGLSCKLISCGVRSFLRVGTVSHNISPVELSLGLGHVLVVRNVLVKKPFLVGKSLLVGAGLSLESPHPSRPRPNGRAFIFSGEVICYNCSNKVPFFKILCFTTSIFSFFYKPPNFEYFSINFVM